MIGLKVIFELLGCRGGFLTSFPVANHASSLGAEVVENTSLEA